MHCVTMNMLCFATEKFFLFANRFSFIYGHLATVCSEYYIDCKSMTVLRVNRFFVLNH